MYLELMCYFCNLGPCVFEVPIGFVRNARIKMNIIMNVMSRKIMSLNNDNNDWQRPTHDDCHKVDNNDYEHNIGNIKMANITIKWQICQWRWWWAK